MDNNERKEKINKLKQELKELLDNCPHDLTIYSWGSADCTICGKRFSWYCPTSPTLECCHDHYGDCIYCGEPNERK